LPCEPGAEAVVTDPAALILALVLFLVPTGLLAFLRLRTQIEIKSSELLLGAVLAGMVLVVTGRVKSLAFGEFKIEAALVEASEVAVRKQVAEVKTLPIEGLVSGAKGSLAALPELAAKRLEALTFVVGQGGYVGTVILEYLDHLVAQPQFRFVVVTNLGGEFVALGDARQLLAAVRSSPPFVSPEELAGWLNRGETEALVSRTGFVPAKDAVKTEVKKRDALEKMEERHASWLPVVDERRRFVGIVDRSRLVASLILDVTEKVER
jgi:CBS domain-containing protein